MVSVQSGRYQRAGALNQRLVLKTAEEPCAAQIQLVPAAQGCPAAAALRSSRAKYDKPQERQSCKKNACHPKGFTHEKATTEPWSKVLCNSVRKAVPSIPKPVLLPLKGPAVGMLCAGDGAKPFPKAGMGGIAAGFLPKAPTVCMAG